MKDGRAPLPSVGIDLVEYAKARALWTSAGPRLRRILTRKEWEAVSRHSRPERKLAEILAGREAAFKSSGDFWMGPDGFAAKAPRRRIAFAHAKNYVVAACVGT